MTTNMLGVAETTRAFRPNGLTFGGCNYSANGLLIDPSAYPQRNFRNFGYPGIPPEMYAMCGTGGVTRATAYNPHGSTKAEEKAIEEAAYNLRDIIRIEETGTFSGDFSGRAVRKEWAKFRDKVKASAEFRNLIENAKKELMDSGVPEDQAKTEAEEIANKQLFAKMCEKYEKYIGVRAKDDIMKHCDYWTNTAKRVNKLWSQLEDISKK